VSWLHYATGARFSAVYYREYTRDGKQALYDLDHDGAADDEPDDIRVDRSPPDASIMVLQGVSVAARTRPAGERGGRDESFVFAWVDLRRVLELGMGPPGVQDAFFVQWRPRPRE